MFSFKAHYFLHMSSWNHLIRIILIPFRLSLWFHLIRIIFYTWGYPHDFIWYGLFYPCEVIFMISFDTHYFNPLQVILMISFDTHYFLHMSLSSWFHLIRIIFCTWGYPHDFIWYALFYPCEVILMISFDTHYFLHMSLSSWFYLIRIIFSTWGYLHDFIWYALFYSREVILMISFDTHYYIHVRLFSWFPLICIIISTWGYSHDLIRIIISTWGYSHDLIRKFLFAEFISMILFLSYPHNMIIGFLSWYRFTNLLALHCKLGSRRSSKLCEITNPTLWPRSSSSFGFHTKVFVN